MARGWESKSVEVQIEEAISEASAVRKNDWSAMTAERQRKCEGLLLQRSRVLQEMAAARNPRYRALLEEKLSHLEHEIYQFR